MVEGFLRSDIFHRAYKGFFGGKKPAPDVTEMEKIEVFLGYETSRLAFVEFRLERMRLVFDSEFYPDKSRKALEEYVESVANHVGLRVHGGDADAIKDADTLRSVHHTKAASRLVIDEIVPSVPLGLGIASLILVDLGLENPEVIMRPRRVG